MIAYDDAGLKRCSKCKKFLPVSGFRKRSRTSDGLNNSCRICADLYKDRDTVKGVAYRLRDQLKFKGGVIISVEESLKFSLGMKSGCEICGKACDESANRKTRALSLDHDHKTGKVRGVLCHRCNVGLGYFQDKPELLKKALTYLKKGETS